MLLAFLDAGDLDLGRLPHDANSAGRLIRLILQGMPAHEALCMASSGAIGLCQVVQTLPLSLLWSNRSLLLVMQTCLFTLAVRFCMLSVLSKGTEITAVSRCHVSRR